MEHSGSDYLQDMHIEKANFEVLAFHLTYTIKTSTKQNLAGNKRHNVAASRHSDMKGFLNCCCCFGSKINNPKDNSGNSQYVRRHRWPQFPDIAWWKSRQLYHWSNGLTCKQWDFMLKTSQWLFMRLGMIRLLYIHYTNCNKKLYIQKISFLKHFKHKFSIVFWV